MDFLESNINFLLGKDLVKKKLTRTVKTSVAIAVISANDICSSPFLKRKSSGVLLQD